MCEDLILIFMETRLWEAALWHGVASCVGCSFVLRFCTRCSLYADLSCDLSLIDGKRGDPSASPYLGPTPRLTRMTHLRAKGYANGIADVARGLDA